MGRFTSKQIDDFREEHGISGIEDIQQMRTVKAGEGYQVQISLNGSNTSKGWINIPETYSRTEDAARSLGTEAFIGRPPTEDARSFNSEEGFGTAEDLHFSSILDDDTPGVITAPYEETMSE